MLSLIIGGSGSGKSAYAESYILEAAGENRKYYLATMQVYDQEGEEKIKRHRKMREGKGFFTLECPVDIEQAAGAFPKGEKAYVLLECMSNLAANEMFSPEGIRDWDRTVSKVIKDVQSLLSHTEHLVIVTNTVFEDGLDYDDTTKEYIRALGRINEKLAAMADRVTEVVVGIPVAIKG